MDAPWELAKLIRSTQLDVFGESIPTSLHGVFEAGALKIVNGH